MIDFKAMQESEKAIYEALKPWTKAERDRIFRHVQEQLNSERAPIRQFNSEVVPNSLTAGMVK